MKHTLTPSLLAKFSGICLLFGFMVIIVACGSTAGQVTPGVPAATVTISFGQVIGSPTSALKGVYCGGWATNATMPYSATGVVNVYGKFTQTGSDGNPTGIGGATATANISWPDNTSDTISVMTTSDGLAVFTVPMKASAINRIVLIQITFVKGNLSCSIPQAAFFTVIVASPTPTGSVSPSPSGSPNGTNTATPSVTPSITPTGTLTGTPSPVPTLPVPFPSPTV
ncbi:MAG TPA: hypothetical protein VGT44_23290 [Ktedonobacteraceae bacterium]|nr:hypothetical protein [Ktedonobacteraceae bacterium]